MSNNKSLLFAQTLVVQIYLYIRKLRNKDSLHVGWRCWTIPMEYTHSGIPIYSLMVCLYMCVLSWTLYKLLLWLSTRPKYRKVRNHQLMQTCINSQNLLAFSGWSFSSFRYIQVSTYTHILAISLPNEYNLMLLDCKVLPQLNTLQEL